METLTNSIQQARFMIQREKPSSELTPIPARATELAKKYSGNPAQYLAIYNPDQIGLISLYEEKCFFSERVATLNEIGLAFGQAAPLTWLVAQLTAVNKEASAKAKMDERDLYNAARALWSMCYHLKITEMCCFFAWLRTARYEKFYASVDMDTIIRSFREFLKDRAQIIDKHEEEERARRRAEDARTAVTYEQYLELKKRGLV